MVDKNIMAVDHYIDALAPDEVRKAWAKILVLLREKGNI